MVAHWHILCTNFRSRYWQPIFSTLGLPYVAPHSARHSFISTLQLQGIEVGLVAKLAGHTDPAVTLAHYTHAVRGGELAVKRCRMHSLYRSYRTPPNWRSRPSWDDLDPGGVRRVISK